MSNEAVKLKNCFIIVGAIYTPLFTSTSTTPLLFIVNLTWLFILSFQLYLLNNKLNNPIIMRWMKSKAKIRDFIFNSLIEYAKLLTLLIPTLYLLLMTLGYEYNENNKESLLEATITLCFLFWSVWLITNVFFVYKRSRHNR